MRMEWERGSMHGGERKNEEQLLKRLQCSCSDIKVLLFITCNMESEAFTAV